MGRGHMASIAEGQLQDGTMNLGRSRLREFSWWPQGPSWLLEGAKDACGSGGGVGSKAEKKVQLNGRKNFRHEIPQRWDWPQGEQGRMGMG